MIDILNEKCACHLEYIDILSNTTLFYSFFFYI